MIISVKFSQLNLSAATLKAIEAKSYVSMTKVQEQVILPMLKGKDLIIQSETGSGKTAAFAIPIIENIRINHKTPQALVIVPTRELARQVSDYFQSLLEFNDEINVLALFGGKNSDSQRKQLENCPEIIVSTPGRIIDFINEAVIDLSSIKTLVIDEADTVIEMGFKDDVNSIFEKTANRKQTAMFSATQNQEIIRLSHQYLDKADHINFSKKKSHELKISHEFFELDEDLRVEAIKRIIFAKKIYSCIIFANNKVLVDKVFKKFKSAGFNCASLHGDFKPGKRDLVMNRFRDGEVNILIASDIAARGIDVAGLDAVFNYQIPHEARDYVHRVGRTGRAGSSGMAFSFVSKKERKYLLEMVKSIDVKLKESSIPHLDTFLVDNFEILKNIFIDSTLSKSTIKKEIKNLNALKEQESEILNSLKNQVICSKEHVLGATLR